MRLNIPINKGLLEIVIKKEEPIFILGVNGSGKSSLIYRMIRIVNQCGVSTELIEAHRQIFFNSMSTDLSNDDIQSIKSSRYDSLMGSDARWVNHNTHSNKLALIQLKQEVNKHNKTVADHHYNKNDEFVFSERPLDIVNNILLSSNINIQLEDENDILGCINNNYIPPKQCHIALLSDGEKNAINLVAGIVSAKTGTVFFIDEPERHLHKSISIKLISSLIKYRRDCFFIISTHDIDLSLVIKNSQILMLKSCSYHDCLPLQSEPSYWDAHLIKDKNIPDELKRDILGSQQQIIFVEGKENSLDKMLYQAIFPNVSIIPKSSCEEVKKSTKGIKENSHLCWLNVFGLIDRDNQTEKEIQKLKTASVFVLKYNSIESIFYHPIMIAFFIKYLTKDENVMASIKSSIMSYLKKDVEIKETLCLLAVNKEINWEYQKKIPLLRKPINENLKKDIEIKVNLLDIYNKELLNYNKIVDENKLDLFIERYCIKKTQLINIILTELQEKKSKYEELVLNLVKTHKEVKDFIVSCLGGLFEKIDKE